MRRGEQGQKKRKVLLGIVAVIGVLGLLSIVVLQNADTEIPPNRIITDLGDSSILPESIEEVKAINGKTPEFSGDNGSVFVITDQDSCGWKLKAGGRLECTFEKETEQYGDKQAMGIGYVADGVMFPPQLFQEEETGTYQITATEAGEYYIYILCASSDPITLKEVEIQRFQ